MTSFKLSIPHVGITCDYSFSPIPIRDRESRKAKAPKEYIIVPMRKSNIVIEGVNVYNHEGEELDRLQLSCKCLTTTLDPFHVEEILQNVFAHDDYPIDTEAKKAKISNTDYCQLVDVLQKNLSTLDQDLYSKQQITIKRMKSIFIVQLQNKMLCSTTMANQKLCFHLPKDVKYILALFH